MGWLENTVAEEGLTTGFLPLKIIIKPENLSVGVIQGFKHRTISEITPAEYAAAMRSGEENVQAQARRSYMLSVAGMEIHVELKPHQGVGTWRGPVLAHLSGARQSETNRSSKAPSRTEKQSKGQTLPDAKVELINQEPIRQNDSLA
ncbi:hypothetical protein CF319_g8243 [Tilletia indica]|uniref:Uncharacterized protein n=1 Tax=Tilletia indica TaxID=43049 RepID=A0A177TB83_9BASI|nr:hypothetical protein CF319_g8243 [Tilletia indica]KAE8244774.1 hypothetical protein A4X13_0g6278 [Tilletia indica]